VLEARTEAKKTNPKINANPKIPVNLINLFCIFLYFSILKQNQQSMFFHNKTKNPAVPFFHDREKMEQGESLAKQKFSRGIQI